MQLLLTYKYSPTMLLIIAIFGDCLASSEVSVVDRDCTSNISKDGTSSATASLAVEEEAILAVQRDPVDINSPSTSRW